MNTYHHITYAALVICFFILAAVTRNCKPKEGLWKYVPGLIRTSRIKRIYTYILPLIRKACIRLKAAFMKKRRKNDRRNKKANMTRMTLISVFLVMSTKIISCLRTCLKGKEKYNRLRTVTDCENPAEFPACQIAGNTVGNPAGTCRENLLTEREVRCMKNICSRGQNSDMTEHHILTAECHHQEDNKASKSERGKKHKRTWKNTYVRKKNRHEGKTASNRTARQRWKRKDKISLR